METLPVNTVSDYEPIASNEERKQLVRNLLCKQATDSELVMFSMACDKAKLDPFSRQIYITKYGGRMTIITGIDGFRVIAQRSGQYLGQKGPFWCGEDGEWKDVWLKDTHPMAAKITVMKIVEGHIAEVSAVAHWNEYSVDSRMWKNMPKNQLAKCAEALALRKAFPNDLSGLYTSDEMDQQKNEPEKKTVKSTSTVKQLESQLNAEKVEESDSLSQPPGELDERRNKAAVTPPPSSLSGKPTIATLTEHCQKVSIAKYEKGKDNNYQTPNKEDIKAAVGRYIETKFKKNCKWKDLAVSEKEQLQEAAIKGDLFVELGYDILPF